MKKSLKVLAAVVVGTGAALSFTWPYLKMEFADSAYYTQQDKREYEYYTPELLKNMPRISDNYKFEFGNVSGPQAHVFTVRFYGTPDTSKVRNYLASVGYKVQAQCDVEAECWRAQRSKDVVTVIQYTSPDSLVVQVYRSPYTE
ncbi:hypothetical protein HL670_01863 [Serratia plymuthica]|uniref:hypothetical protein n=1 Tax=Serratia plymuthica TaxID=82996 RepID=UPI000788EB58|nr:hypothetical protein [Serratia plymuthica]QJW54979.1 hypothetical protein HL670_01863 [Serratia plymuthica]